MPSYRSEALVLRIHQLGEADNILTLFSREHGKVRAVAKGVRRTRSKFGGRLEPFSRVDLLLSTGKSLDIVTQADLLNSYGDELAQDFRKWTVAHSIVEMLDRLTPEDRVANEEQYLLVIGALRTLANEDHEPTAVLDAYLLRSLTLAGYAPALDVCVTCGEPTDTAFFHVPSGGILCVTHRVPGSVTPSVESIALMDALIIGDWEYVDSSSENVRREVSGIVAAYTQWHLEKGLRSLPLVDRS